MPKKTVKVSKQNKEKEEAYYVGVEQAGNVRKSLLFGAKLVITSLQRYEKYKEIRRQKIAYMFELRRLIKELAILNRKLTNALPKTELKPMEERPPEVENLTVEQYDAPLLEEAPSAKPKKSKAKSKTKKTKPKKSIHQAQPTQLELLERELSKVEEKLSLLED